jgi:hypothetical protein
MSPVDSKPQGVVFELLTGHDELHPQIYRQTSMLVPPAIQCVQMQGLEKIM